MAHSIYLICSKQNQEHQRVLIRLIALDGIVRAYESL